MVTFDAAYRMARAICAEIRLFPLSENEDYELTILEQVCSIAVQQARMEPAEDRLQRFYQDPKSKDHTLLGMVYNNEYLSEQQKNGIIQSLADPYFMVGYFADKLQKKRDSTEPALRKVPRMRKANAVLWRLLRAFAKIVKDIRLPEEESHIRAGMLELVENMDPHSADWSLWEAGSRFPSQTHSVGPAGMYTNKGYTTQQEFLLRLCMNSPAFLLGELMALAVYGWHEAADSKKAALELLEQARQAIEADTAKENSGQSGGGHSFIFGLVPDDLDNLIRY